MIKRILSEILITIGYGVGAILTAAAVILAVGGSITAFLFLPGYLIIDREMYVIGTIYTVVAWGTVWRLTK